MRDAGSSVFKLNTGDQIHSLNAEALLSYMLGLILPLLSACTAQGPSVKRGIAWANQENYLNSGGPLSKGPFGWWYNWWEQSYSPPMDGASFQYVPTLQHDNVDRFKSDISNTNPKYIIGFNEPDNPEDIEISTYAEMWNSVVPDLRSKGVQAISPSAIYGTESWLGKFLEQGAVFWDFSNLHLYTKDIDELKNAVAELHAAYGKPVWVTEFACLHYEGDDRQDCSDDETAQFMKEALDFLDNSDQVAAYAWEGFNTGEVNRLVDHTGSLTNLGKIYSTR